MLAPPYFTGRDRGAIEVTIVRSGGARRTDIPVLFSYATGIFKCLKYNDYSYCFLGLFTVKNGKLSAGYIKPRWAEFTSV
jgi:hypothetical protein